MSHASGNAAHAGTSVLHVLQTKYEAVLAENEELARQLQAERLQRRRAEVAYTHIQSDVQRDQNVLHELLATMTADSAGAPSGNARVNKLERECVRLQSKVESLHSALRRYEEDAVAQVERTEPADVFKGSERCSTEVRASAGASACREAEQAARGRAEVHLSRCHAAIDAMRDDKRKTEAAFYQQLAALQEQNAALLEDLDTWVTGAQQHHLARALPAQHAPSSPRLPEPQSCAAEEVKLRALRRHMEDQEAVIVAKDKSIVQLEGRVRELTALGVPSATPALDGRLYIAQLANVHSDAVSLMTFMASCAAEIEAMGIYLPAAPQRSASAPSTPASMLADTRAALRAALAVLRITLLPAQARAVQRTPTASTTSDVTQSGETLADAAQALAALMRAHAGATACDEDER